MATSQPLLPSKKRDLEGRRIENAFTSVIASSVDVDSSAGPISRQTSPALSTATSALTELSSAAIVSPRHAQFFEQSDLVTAQGDNPSKRPKLNFAEKEVEKAVKKLEKDEKARQRLADKAQKEEEKRQRDEDRRRKEEEKEVVRRAKELEKAERKKIDDAKKREREEKKKIKDAEKHEKDIEKAKREAEKLKKDRSQMRIGAFFGRPAPASTPPATPDDASNASSSRRSSIAALEIEERVLDIESQKPTNPDFEKYIIPYFVHDHTDIAPINRFQVSRRAVMFEGKASAYCIEVEHKNVEPLAERFKKKAKLSKPLIPIRKIVENIQSGPEASSESGEIAIAVSSASFKYLSFREDVRPPYMGTYTGVISPRVARRLSRNPTYRGRTDTNYDYDSEAEWEPPADDDDDINLDDEMSDEEDDEEDMDDFLDDENDLGRKRLFVGEMEPISSGICWQSDLSAIHGHVLEQYRMDVLHDSTTFPIDPFASNHWTDETRSKGQATPEVKGKQEHTEKAMLPPRIPLTTVTTPNILPGFFAATSPQICSQKASAILEVKQRGRPADPNKPVKMISVEFLPAFKQAIDGSDLTKAGLIEVLKKQFPKCSKDAIKDTLGMVAVRVGKKEAEKKWALVT